MSWNDSTYFCSWEGVSCRTEAWSDKSLLHFGNLTFLRQLQLPINSFTGEIPPSLGHLHHLQILNLGDNPLQGRIPNLSNCSNLMELSLYKNNLAGEFPQDLPHHLQVLQLSFNNLTGRIPASLSNISTLKILSCVSNNFEGNIPNEFAKFPMLHTLFVDLAFNDLSGEVPSNIGDALPNLELLALSHNVFQGHIPCSLVNASQLNVIDIPSNIFTGVIPTSIGKLTKLHRLNLDFNDFEARLESNQFTGVVPNWIGALKSLQRIALVNNNFTGPIPTSLLNLSQLGLLYLDFNNFDGHIPPSLGKIQMLEVLNVSNNNLHGSIPKEIFIGLERIHWKHPLFSREHKKPDSFKLFSQHFTGLISLSLGDLLFLEQLDLSFNHLSGAVPTNGIFKNATFLWIEGNQDLCGGPPELHLLTCSSFTASVSSKYKKSIVLKVVIPIASMVSLAIVITTIFLSKRKLKRQSLALPSFDEKFPKVTFTDLARATDRFSTSNLIGKGRFSSVYLGKLFQGNDVVAVKVFSLETRGAQKSFIAECMALRNIRHRNMVPIITACSSVDFEGNNFFFLNPAKCICIKVEGNTRIEGNNFKALVYKFMPRGDLHNFLYSTRDDGDTSNLNLVTLSQRISIVVDVSDALEYLDHNNQGTIVHCDLKPSNILLDDNMIAHVGDFGLSRFKINSSTSSLGDSNSTSSLAIKGTIGYIAPECSQGGQVSTASDIYSFGVVLLEIFIRRRPTDDMFKDGLSIVKYTEMNFPERILEVVDPQLQLELDLCEETPMAVKEKGLQCLRSVLSIGLCCTKTTPSERISMQEAAAKLHGIKDAEVAMKVSVIGPVLLLLMACSSVQILSSSLSGNETDKLSLLEFKKAITLDPQQALISWNDSTHLCIWEGVLCRKKTPLRVVSLDLSNRGLVGQISPSLANLTFLKFLFLDTNSFTGDIPSSLGHLHHLQTLYLSNNTLEGVIPDLTNCSNLKALWLNGNRLVGQMNINFPPQLQELALAYNNLTGTIPPSFANFTELRKLSFSHNNIKGSIPNEFSNFLMMEVLILSRFPEAILNLSTLIDLSLGSNHLSGEVPSNLLDSLPNLQQLGLGNNFFQGHIPHSLGNTSNLRKLYLSRNNFTGVVPTSIGKLTELNILNLEVNQIQAHKKEDWEFIDSLANCSSLQTLSMVDNRLQGHIPSSLGNISTRSLPEWLGKLKQLQMLGLQNNYFTGIIPSSLSNMSQLIGLFLGSNKLDGHIPSLESLQMLEIFTIPNNNLYGSIPKEIFSIPSIMTIDMSFNNLDGKLPPSIGNAKQLTYLALSSNKLFGDIPNSLVNCESLEHIEFDFNIFSGGIPTSLGSISGLKVINFSHNNLTGSIPASLGNLQFLEQLDLSFNHLMGEVPGKGIFKNASSMRIDGNKGLCGGPPELHLQRCSFVDLVSSKHDKSILLKVMIPVASMVSLGMVIIIVFLWRGKQKRKSLSLPSLARHFPKISYNILFRATGGFSTSNLIGKGRYSTVYLGKLFEDNNMVAVKVFNLETRGAQKSFITECNTLRNVRHRNLVPILTACASIDSKGNDFKALVYKFMGQGDLHALLHSTQNDENTSYLNHITLAQRISIVVDVSDALEYLHHNSQGTIIHCDLKPSNILLDNNMIAHVGDFGLARFKTNSSTPSPGDSNSTSSLAIKGTIGYIAPVGGQVSTASDVYSFGVVLLEIFIRRRPTDDIFKDGLSIANFTEMNFPDRILEIVDPQLQQELDLCEETPTTVKEKGFQCLRSVLDIGLCCTKPTASERVSMQEAAAKLHAIKDAYLS
uniref:Receptor kinase-like protein Xa21 n=1 Tax=Oryza punctata TaxID=4537 RepID=A0A0E0MCY5_ORYPU